MPYQPWDGITERRVKAQDHDTLIEVVQILSAHVKNFDKHVVDDADNFKTLNRTMWMCAGGLSVIAFVIKFIH